MFESSTTKTAIKTRASNVAVKATSTIRLRVLIADSIINNVTLSRVLYALGMFISIVSYSKIRAKGYYYYS